MFHVFSGFHCVISFIACAKISFTIAIYFPRIFLSQLEMKKKEQTQMEEMKRMNKKSSYLLLLVWLRFSLLLFLCFFIWKIVSCFSWEWKMRKMLKSLSLSINWWFKEFSLFKMRSLFIHFTHAETRFYLYIFLQPHLKPNQQFSIFKLKRLKFIHIVGLFFAVLKYEFRRINFHFNFR